jgi:SAM-dependent methyltransferase
METIHTPSCAGSEKAFITAQDRNRRVDSYHFDYLRCERCGVIRLANPPQDLGKYYPGNYYSLPSPTKLAAVAAKNPFKIDLVRQFSKPGRLLEIGPAFGTFALQAKQAGYEVRAIEMDTRCCAYLNEQLGISAVRGDVPHEVIPKLGTQDVIALWHVIEHLPDPWALIRSAALALSPGGILVIATPNPSAWQFARMGRAWPHIDAPRHLYLLPAAAITDYAALVGLESVHLDTDDDDARSWNRFGWQRLIMNIFTSTWPQRAAFVAGSALSALLAPLDRIEGRGSAYTLVLRKAS